MGMAIEQASGEKMSRADRAKRIAPTALVVETAANLSPGTAVDLACGGGRNALYLAEKGWTVTAIDGIRKRHRTGSARASARNLAMQTAIADLTSAGFALHLTLLTSSSSLTICNAISSGAPS